MASTGQKDKLFGDEAPQKTDSENLGLQDPIVAEEGSKPDQDDRAEESTAAAKAKEEELIKTEESAQDEKDEGDKKISGESVSMEIDTPDEIDSASVKKEAEASAATASIEPQNNRPRKRARSPDASGGNQQSASSVSAASAAAAAQLAATMGWNGIYSLLIAKPSGSTSGGGSSGASGSSSLQLSMMVASNSASAASSSSLSSTNNLPTVQQVQQAVAKYLSDIPPFVHLSKADSAPQLKLSGLNGGPDDRLTVKGGMRGYRMARATHGVSAGNYYYEVIVLPPPKVSEIVASLPPNARLGKALQAQLQAALQQEQEEEREKEKESPDGDDENAVSKKKDAPARPRSTFGGHIRLGWSMRTGDLQAPVGYDKWSFGIRDIDGSKIHCSRRDDNWGGEGFQPGDIVGCAISLYDPKKDGNNNNTAPLGIGGVSSAYNNDNGMDGRKDHENHIRFFKNGRPMGRFVISKGKREGGTAFQIPDGVYYPAISLYMGASCRVNFGPHFICPPKKLPPSLKGIKPISDLCPAPVPVEDAIAKVQKEKTFRKPDKLQLFQELVKAEVQVLHDVYNEHYKSHLQEVLGERKERKIPHADLESIKVETAPAES